MTGETELSPPNPETGQLVAGRYELRGLLGRGSMGAVHSGQDVVLDRPVAVKIFPQGASVPGTAARYEQEARLLARLSHPALVTVFDAGIDATVADDPQPYLVMELVSGETLADRIHRGPLSPAQTAELAAELSSALAYIHRRGVIHRDVKPANILLAAPDGPDEPEHAKLTDFGIARLMDGTRLTETGLALGTANYLSPEQLTGEEVGPASDIYSLGLVLLECLTGRLAYPGHGAEAAFVRLHRPPEIPDSVPDGWTRLLRAMTDRDPSVRPGAADIGVAVTGLAAAETSPPAPAPLRESPLPPTQVLSVPTPAAPAARSRRRPAALWYAAAGLVAVIAIVIGVAVSGGGSAPNVPDTPSYPSVPGQLGTHLRQLQQDVEP